MPERKIAISLMAFDYRLLDKAAKEIVDTAGRTGARRSGPIPLPTRKQLYAVLRSPHVNSASRDQFQICTHKRQITIIDPTEKTMDALMKLSLPSGVEVNINVI